MRASGLTLLVTGALAALRVAAGPGITVRANGRVVSIPVFGEGAASAVRADALTLALDGSMRRLANGHYQLMLPGAQFDLAARTTDAVVDGDSVVLARAPYLEGSALFVPLQLVTDLLPRYGSGLMFDASRRELRQFQGTISSGARPRRNPPEGADASARTNDAPVVARSMGTTPAGARTRRYKVVVDAGHGGPDRGMTGPIGGGPRIAEKDITLAVARKLAASLRARGIDVLMTRTTDTLIALSDRGRIANQSHADLFVSVHVNAANPGWSNPGAARGFETYFLAEAKTEDARRVEQMENEAVRFETSASAQRGDPLNFIINDMAQNEHLRESSELAAAIQRGLATMHPAPSRGVKQANFAVLRTSFMPAVLVEIGFGTNPSDAAFISDEAHEREIAEAVASATDAYLGRYERRVGARGR